MPVLADLDMPVSVVIAHSSLRSGLMVENITPQLGDFFGVKGGSGVLVRSVEKGSRSEKAGFRAGDVIVRVNNESVHDTSDFTRALRATSGGAAAVTVIRDKREQNLNLTLPDKKDSGNLIEESFDAPEMTEDAQIEWARAGSEIARMADSIYFRKKYSSSSQFFLVRKAAPKTGQASIAADHAVARNNDGNGIAAIRKSHRAHRLRIPNLLRELRIRYGFAIRNCPQADPYTELKLRSLRCQGQIKLLQFSGEIRLQLPNHFGKRRSVFHPIRLHRRGSLAALKTNQSQALRVRGQKQFANRAIDPRVGDFAHRLQSLRRCNSWHFLFPHLALSTA